MAWSPAQIKIAAAVATQVGHPEMREVVLRNLPEQRAIHNGRPTSKSPKLTQADWELYMARFEPMFERNAVVLVTKKGVVWQSFGPDHFVNLIDGEQGDAVRLRWIARRIDATFELELDDWRLDESLRPWVRRQSNERTDDLEALSYREVHGLLAALRGFARRHGVQLNPTRATYREPVGA